MVRDSRVLICQRTAEQAFPLQWEFPGGKVEAGEELAAALRRELREELGIEASVGARDCHRAAPICRRAGRGVALLPGDASLTGEIENRIFREVRWEERTALDAEGFLEADRGVVRELAGSASESHNKHLL